MKDSYTVSSNRKTNRETIAQWKEEDECPVSIDKTSNWENDLNPAARGSASLSDGPKAQREKKAVRGGVRSWVHFCERQLGNDCSVPTCPQLPKAQLW